MIQFLKGILFASASILLLSGAWFCVETIRTEKAITAAAIAVPAIVDSRLVSLQAETLKLVDAHAKNLEDSVNGAVRTADNRLAGIQEVAEKQLTAANRELATVTRLAATAIPETASSVTKSIAGIATDVHQVAAPIAQASAQVNDALPLYLDCEYNPDCAFNRFQGTSKAIEQSAQAIAKAAPQMAQSAVSIEGSAASITKSVDTEVTALTAPKHWWQRLLGFAGLGATVAARVF